jgi:hypothetical protein
VLEKAHLLVVRDRGAGVDHARECLSVDRVSAFESHLRQPLA